GPSTLRAAVKGASNIGSHLALLFPARRPTRSARSSACTSQNVWQQKPARRRPEATAGDAHERVETRCIMKPWLNVSEAAEYAGVSRDTIYTACERREVRH